jgi:general secretion pathway protein C
VRALNDNRAMSTALRPSSPWGLRLATLALWALAGASVVYWGLRLSARPGPAAPAAAAPAAAPDVQAIGRLLGAGGAPVAAAPATRFVLVGVLAGQSSGAGAALIAVDGKPARPYRVGAPIEPGLVLQHLDARGARLGASADGPGTLKLDMPPLSTADAAVIPAP